jgi:predicted transcriptional regulator
MAAKDKPETDNVTFRVPKPLKRRLRVVAAKQDRDMTAFAVAALEVAVAAAEKRAA